MGVLCLFLFCYALLCILSTFAFILKRKRELVVLLLLSYGHLVAVNMQFNPLKSQYFFCISQNLSKNKGPNISQNFADDLQIRT